MASDEQPFEASAAIAGSRPDSFPLLDGLRGLAALAVFAFHGFLIIGWNDVPEWVDRVGETQVRAFTSVTTYMGWEAVAVFYVMSAFLLYRPFVLARMEGQSSDVGRFAIRRVARILPAYWLALVLLGLLGRGSNVFSLSGLRDYFLFGQIYSGQGTTWNNPVEPAWTICVEVSFYIFLPVWAWLAAKLVGRTRNPVRTEALMLLCLMLVSVGWKVFALGHTTIREAHQPLLLTLPGSLDVFAAGMLVALCSVPAVPAGERLGRFAARRFLAVGTAAMIFLLMCGLAASGSVLDGEWKKQVMTVSILKIPVAALLLVVATFSVRSGGFTRRLFAFRAVAWVGVVSYGFYLWHVALFRWTDQLLGQGTVTLLELPLVIAAVLVAALGIAAASWYLVERPILRRVHRRKSS